MAREISNNDDIIDSREVIERIEELEADDERTDDESEELKALQALAADAEGYADDWRHGAALIRDSYFETYAQEFAEEIGAINGEARWPNSCIDWEQASRELQMDYTSVDFDGVTYWVR